nr:heavy metal-associated domain-containing protein [uncultured Roseococcus sp.]
MTRIKVTNMTCGGCARGVAASLQDAAGKELQIDLERREILVGGEAKPQALLDLLRADGWQAELISS